MQLEEASNAYPSRINPIGEMILMQRIVFSLESFSLISKGAPDVGKFAFSLNPRNEKSISAVLLVSADEGSNVMSKLGLFWPNVVMISNVPLEA